ncbi:hypothetical protein Hamer_G020470, partial [Homarus americanus]
ERERERETCMGVSALSEGAGRARIGMVVCGGMTVPEKWVRGRRGDARARASRTFFPRPGSVGILQCSVCLETCGVWRGPLAASLRVLQRGHELPASVISLQPLSLPACVCIVLCCGDTWSISREEECLQTSMKRMKRLN